MATHSALVLGSGGITGTAWEVGVLAGLAEAGLDLTDAATIVGTSAGSVAGAQIGSGTPIETLYARQLAAPDPAERYARTSRRTRLGVAGSALLHPHDVEAFGRRLGRIAETAERRGRTPRRAQRLEQIRSRLPSASWPQRDLRIAAVNARTGVFHVFTAADQVPLAEAVAASCAVPGVYPPIPAGGEIYIDGGYRSGANVDVARGAERIVVLAPLVVARRPRPGPQAQLEALGVPGTVISPDADARSAIGSNPLDPAARRGAAEGGRAQAARILPAVAEIWR